MTTSPHCAIIVFWSDEDGAWVANVPDLKSCSAFGDTPEEAVAEVCMAMEAWLAADRDAGHQFPSRATTGSTRRPNSPHPAVMPAEAGIHATFREGSL
jgi:predicted RNase H-like HicB family nuclease